MGSEPDFEPCGIVFLSYTCTQPKGHRGAHANDDDGVQLSRGRCLDCGQPTATGDCLACEARRMDGSPEDRTCRYCRVLNPDHAPEACPVQQSNLPTCVVCGRIGDSTNLTRCEGRGWYCDDSVSCQDTALKQSVRATRLEPDNCEHGERQDLCPVPTCGRKSNLQAARRRALDLMETRDAERAESARQEADPESPLGSLPPDWQERYADTPEGWSNALDDSTRRLIAEKVRRTKAEAERDALRLDADLQSERLTSALDQRDTLHALAKHMASDLEFLRETYQVNTGKSALEKWEALDPETPG